MVVLAVAVQTKEMNRMSFLLRADMSAEPVETMEVGAKVLGNLGAEEVGLEVHQAQLETLG